MTNNPTIDGRLRETVENAIEALTRHLAGHAPMQVPPSKSDSDLVREELRALLDADHIVDSGKMVEPVAPFYISAEDWNLLVRADVEIASVRVSRTRRSIFTESLFAHPTEVAALQSTIAQLQARVAELEKPKHTMKTVMSAMQKVHRCPLLTSNQCQALANALNKD